VRQRPLRAGGPYGTNRTVWIPIEVAGSSEYNSLSGRPNMAEATSNEWEWSRSCDGVKDNA